MTIRNDPGGVHAQPTPLDGPDRSKLWAILVNIGYAAHFGGEAMDTKRRGGREKLAYIKRQAAEALELLNDAGPSR